ncbi:hypothetical protein F442_08912 [Phytophthora nicotianae P10297]|uniref:Uncharacterized protein n=1 Tax=Phytophthora nicotianae P10297 TaxID=1317064 RepID=W2ZBW3_PHYNI|nr:hypothetical protein F442_08912 [Phytophthora nicotianae P10297]
MDQLVEAAKTAASNATTVYVPHGGDLFKGYKKELTELYKRLDGIQQYQIFSMDSSKPGVVCCRMSPESEVVEVDLHRKFDGVLTLQKKVTRMLTEHLESLPPPNTENIAQMYQSIRPNVPDVFRDDPLYEKPSARQEENAKAAKKARRIQCAAMAVAAKRN